MALVCSVICMCLFLGSSVCRAGETGEKRKVTVADDAKILMEEEADWLEDVAGKLSEKSGWNVVVATCSDAEGKSARTVSEEYFNSFTAGDDGISCLVDLDNRELYLATAGDAQRYLTDSRLDDILEKAHAAAQKEDYAQALYLMLYESEQMYAKGMPEGAAAADKKDGFLGTAGNILLMMVVAGGGFFLGRVIRRRPAAGQPGYRRQPYRRPPAARTNVKRPANRSTVHRGAGGRKFGGRGRKF